MKPFAIVFLLFFGLQVQAYQAKGVLEGLQKEETIPLGDTFQAKLTVYPIESFIGEDVRSSLDGSMFLDLFFVHRIDMIRKLPQNPEVLEVRFSLVLTKAITPGNFYIWSYKGLNIPVELKNIRTEKADGNKEIYIFEQQLESSRYVLLGGGALAFIVFAAGVTIFLRKKKSKIAGKNQDLERIKELFRTAKERVEFEEIYGKKDFWLREINGMTPDIHYFFKELNKVQFKKDWNEVDRTMVASSFENIRGLFERGIS